MSGLGKGLVVEGKKTWGRNSSKKFPLHGRWRGITSPAPFIRQPPLQGLASTAWGAHTYTPTPGFRGFPYLSQTTFSPANKDHLSCLSQTRDHWEAERSKWRTRSRGPVSG